MSHTVCNWAWLSQSLEQGDPSQAYLQRRAAALQGQAHWETEKQIKVPGKQIEAVVTAARLRAPGSRKGHSPLRTRQGTEMFAPRPQSALAAGKVITGREFKPETKKLHA